MGTKRLNRLLGKLRREDFFNLDPALFPKTTSGLISIETILKFGILPLGFKARAGLFKPGKLLNLGLIDPGKKEALEIARKEAGPEFKAIKTFLISTDQFLSVLSAHYGLSADQLLRKPKGELAPTVSLHLMKEKT
jgi:hypothetical protein